MYKTLEVLHFSICVIMELLHEAKLKLYTLLEIVDRKDLYNTVCRTRVVHGIEQAKEEVDKVVEDEITSKLNSDLLQSIERKFQVDLERSVDMVLMKIKLLLQNGTHHIQDKLVEIQGMLDVMKEKRGTEVEKCLLKKENETSSLAERTLHQMVVCGYALIGQDPAHAVNTVIKLKNMIRRGMKPIYEQKLQINGLLKVCGHNHDTLRKVVQCVISKSPIIKSAMMEITGRLSEGVVELTKLMAHGAMHEACLIEVLKSIEDEAVLLINEVRHCVYDNDTYFEELDNFLAGNNATVLDIKDERKKVIESAVDPNSRKEDKMEDFLNRVLAKENAQHLDKKFNDNLINLDINVNGANSAINLSNDKSKDI